MNLNRKMPSLYHDTSSIHEYFGSRTLCALVPKSRDYARLAEMWTLSEVTIGFYVKLRIWNRPNIILQRNMEIFSRIIRSTQGQNVNFGRGSGGAMP